MNISTLVRGMPFNTALLALFFLSVMAPLSAQPWLDNGGDTLTNFYDIQRKFNEYWKDRKVEKGKGWKQFKRWEWFWEQRVAPSGVFPNPAQLLIERPVLKDKKDKVGDKVLNGTNLWTALGPSQSSAGYSGLGRVNCITVHPTNSNIIWIGTGGGGAWKTTTGGSSWSNTTDILPTLGVGDIAIDPTNANTVYLATGDGDAGDAYSVGVLKSTDGGDTWNATGLTFGLSQRFTMSRILIHPTSTNTLLVATSNGIYRTTNGGTNWTQTRSGSFKDIEFKPDDPSVVYAGGVTTGGNNSIFRSTDGGATWSQITSGLPSSNAGRISIAVSPANPSYVYALIVNASNNGFLGLYASTNSGVSWSVKSSSPNILDWGTGTETGGQGWYDLSLAVSPVNEQDVYVGGINIWRSVNGGASWSKRTHWYDLSGYATVHADHHTLYFEPGTTKLFVGNDGGIYSSTNNGTTWNWLGNGLEITQFYRLGTSASNSNKLIAGAQDNGTKLMNGGAWSDVYGGDGMEAAIDPGNENIIYACSQNGGLGRSVNGGSNFASIRPTTADGSWITPFMLNPQNPITIYSGYTNVWKSLNRGTTWTQISNFTGNATLNILQVAPSDSNTIYASTGSTNLRRTTDGGLNWSTLTLPTNLTLTYLAVHPADPQKIWATFSGYLAGNKVFTSVNGGSSWSNVSGSLPNIPVNCIVYQNNSPDRIYVGTDAGVYYTDQSLSDWQEYNQNLPNVVIDELEIHYNSGKLYAATFGRGIWRADIITGSITTSAVENLVCTGGQIAVPYTITNGMLAGNVFTAQLSDAQGNFSSAVNIGTLTGTTAGTITATIPANTPAGSGYKIRVISSNPPLTGAVSPTSVSVQVKPDAEISGVAMVCAGNISYYTTLSGLGVTNSWFVTGGIAQGTTNKDTLSVLWGATSQGQIKLVQTGSAAGCKDSVIIPITITPLPQPAFTGELSVCPGTTASYTSPVSGVWKALNGTIIGPSTGTSVVVLWPKSGSSSLQFIQASESGCRDSVVKSITFKSNFNPVISGAAYTCKGTPAHYSAQTSSGVSYQWLATGGTISGSSSGQTVTVNWDNTTSPSLRLIQNSIADGCSDTTIMAVIVYDPPTVTITGDFQNITNGKTTTHAGAANPAGTNVWKVQGGTIVSGAGTEAVQILWNTTGAASLKLVQTNSAQCRDSAVENFTVKAPSAVTISGQSKICKQGEATYSLPIQEGMSVAWTTNGGQIANTFDNSAVIFWPEAGSMSVKAVRTISATGFKDSAEYSVTVFSLPEQPVITKNQLTLQSNAASGNQWFRNGEALSGQIAQTLTPTQSGRYSVQVTSTETCVSEMSEEFEYTLVSVQDSEKTSEQLVVTPNPASTTINIECPVPGVETVQMTLIDLSGKEVLKTQMQSTGRRIKGSLDIQTMAPGTYFLNIHTSVRTFTAKVSINR
jgi:photosystem II stability/assembly factor-like uncharacterized protein